MNHFILDGRYEDLLSHYKFNVEEALKKPIFPTLFSSFIRICIFSGTFAQDDQRSYFPLKITMTSPVNDEQVINFFGCKIESGKSNTITFAKKDLQVNFISYN